MEKIEDVINSQIGETYLVKCVQSVLAYEIGEYKHWAPVFGDYHEDKGIAQERYHFHVDWRFMPEKYIKEIQQAHKSWKWYENEKNTHNYVAITDRLIIGYKRGFNNYNYGTITEEELEKYPVTEDDFLYLPLVYLRDFDPLDKEAFEKLVTIYKSSGKKMKNMVCPHKNTKLHSCKTIDGVVQCPLHGLKWNVKTGELANC